MTEIHKKRMLITGVSGLLGNNLACYFKDKYDILGLYHLHEVNLAGIRGQKADCLLKDSIERTLSEFSPAIIIHCAALADIDACQKNPELAARLNVSATQNIVDGIKGADTKLIYISTDAVYDGKRGNYKEDDAVNPLNTYGLTKYEGEQKALKAKNTLIARTNFFGRNIQDKRCLAEWIVAELSQQKEIQGFVDAYFSSIYTFDLAKLLDAALAKDINGIYHFASKTFFSKYEFAVKLATLFDLDVSLIKPISINGSHFAAPRGKNLTLNTSKLQASLDCSIPMMIDTMDAFYHDFQRRNINVKEAAC